MAMSRDDHLSKELATLRDRLRVLEDAEREAARVLAMDRALGWGVLQSKTLREILDRSVQAMVENLDAALARIWLLDEQENVLVLQASAGLYTHLTGAHGRIPVGSLKIGSIARERRPHLTNAVVGDPRVPDQEWAKRERLVSFAGYPLLVGDRLIGVVAMFARRPLSDLVLQAMASVAGRIAYAVERIRSEEALARSEERFRALVEHSSDAVSLLDAQATIVYAGPSTRRVLGYESEELIGTDAFRLVHPEDIPAARDTLSRIVAEPGSTLNAEIRLLHRNRGWIWAECVGTNCLNNPQVRGVIVNYRDITERKRTEQAIRQREKMESLGYLASGIAHDFNNLLTRIIGNASMLLDDADPGRAQRVREVIAGAERAAYLTRQLLAYSGKGAFTVERIDVGRLIRDMEPLLRASVPETIALQLETPENLPEIEADAEQIRQALMNLVINAAEAIGEHNRGCVHIRTGQHDLGSDEIRRDFSREELIPGSYVAIEVRDTGIGMDESIRSRIFDPFFTTKFLGRGLGLAAVWGIVRAGRGAIRVSSAPGKGSTFQVLLPAAARRFARQI